MQTRLYKPRVTLVGDRLRELADVRLVQRRAVLRDVRQPELRGVRSVLCAALGFARPCARAPDEHRERLSKRLCLRLRVGNSGRLKALLDTFDECWDCGGVDEVKRATSEEDRHGVDDSGGGLLESTQKLALGDALVMREYGPRTVWRTRALTRPFRSV